MKLKMGWGEQRVADVRAAVVGRGETVSLPTAPEDMVWTAAHLQEVLGLAVRVKQVWQVHGRSEVVVSPAVPVELMLDFVLAGDEGQRRLVAAVVVESRRMCAPESEWTPGVRRAFLRRVRNLAAGEVDVSVLAERGRDGRQGLILS